MKNNFGFGIMGGIIGAAGLMLMLSATGIGARQILGEPVSIQAPGWLEVPSITDPGTPASGKAWLYADSGNSDAVTLETNGGESVIPVSNAAFVLTKATMQTSSTVIGTAGATAFTFTGDGNDTWSANTLLDGMTVNFVLSGSITTDGSESEQLRIRTYVDTTSDLLADTADIDVSTAQTASPWILRGTYVQTSAGASGAYKVDGVFWYFPTGGSVAEIPFHKTGTLDTTAAQDLPVVTATWTDGDATPDVVTCDIFSVTYSDTDGV